MDAVYCNTLAASLREAFGTLLGCRVRRASLEAGDRRYRDFDISGVIGLSGDAVGTVVVSFSKAVALQATSAMLLVETLEVDADVVDAVGELTNMIVGPAKAHLPHCGLQLTLPNVITGTGHHVSFPSNVTPIAVTFHSDWGPLALTVGMSRVGSGGARAEGRGQRAEV